MSSQSSNRQPLSEQERREAFASPRAPLDRAAILREGPPATPTKFLAFAAAILAVVVLSGVLVETLAGNAASTPRTTVTTRPTPSPVGRALATLMTLTPRHGTAPALTLTDQHGTPWSLGAQRGRVVVLGFVDQSCNDLCPVIGAELRRARELAGAGSRLTVALVNTDPHRLGVEPAPPALTRSDVAGASTVFLTGSLTRMNRVWRDYGVSIRYYPQDGRLVHNNVLYFIDPAGREAVLAVPFGDESASGAYHLGAREIARFARGIALEVDSLLR
ncbi:MAG: SCO family protein [Acidimicrobiales bacterium]